jgi:hypothetical protein
MRKAAMEHALAHVIHMEGITETLLTGTAND